MEHVRWQAIEVGAEGDIINTVIFPLGAINAIKVADKLILFPQMRGSGHSSKITVEDALTAARVNFTEGKQKIRLFSSRFSYHKGTEVILTKKESLNTYVYDGQEIAIITE